MRLKVSSSLLATAAVAALGIPVSGVSAATLYAQNFESPVTVGSSAPATGSFYNAGNSVQGSGFQVQGGCGAGTVTTVAGVDNNGTGGSQALVVTNDNSAASQYTYAQLTTYGSVVAPGAGTLTSQVQINLSIFISGSEGSNTPIGVNLQNNGSVFTYTPTLANGVLTPVTFTLNQATQTSGVNPYDPTAASTFQISYGAGGFGFDAGNIVRVDNILIQTVPEPASIGLLATGGLTMLRRRR